MVKTRKLWSEKEDSALRREVSQQVANHGEVKDWRRPAATLPGRNNKDCRKRWLKLEGPVNKGKWSEEENERLRQAVRLHSRQWTEVARVVRTRHADQCAKRWLHFLNPELDYSEWTPPEDERLLAEVEKNGRNWRRIVDEVLTGRSATDAKNRYIILQRHKRNDTDPVRSTTTRPARRKRPRSVSCHGGDNGTEEEAQPPVDSGIDSYMANSMDPMDTLFDRDAFDDALKPPNTFDEMLSDAGAELEKPIESKTILLSHGNPGMVSSDDWQTSTASFQQNVEGIQHPGIKADLLDLVCAKFAHEGSSRDNGSAAQANGSANNDHMELAFSDHDSIPDLSETATSSSSTPTPASVISDDGLTYVNPIDCFGGDQWSLDKSLLEDSGDTDMGRATRSFILDESSDSWSTSSQAGLDSPVPSIESYTDRDGCCRESKMVLEHMQPDLVERVLSLVLTSKSPIDVKIYGQDEMPT